MELLGVLGYPLTHSLSPVMHGAALAERGVIGAYLPLEVEPSFLGGALEGLRHLPFRGANVTVPYKEKVFLLVDQLAPSAQKAGAVNTLERSGHRLVGHNTDGAGFLASLAEAGIDPAGRRVLLLGAGGAARAVAFALMDAKVEQIILVNRTPQRAKGLADALAERTQAVGMDRLPELLAETELLINATPIGMYPHGDESPVENLSPLPTSCPVVDLVYNPRPTSLLRRAGNLGHLVLDGLGMLVHQGALSWQIWFGEMGPVEIMRRAALEALEHR